MINAKGVKQLLVTDFGISLQILESSIQDKNLDKIGICLVYPSKAIFSAQINGSLIVVESGLEFAES